MKNLPRPIVGVLAVGLACAACGTGGVGSDCGEPVDVTSLLRLDCRGRVVSGLARARVDGSAVVLEFLQGQDSDLVLDRWPPMDRPPWLGHGPVRVDVVDDRRIRLEFPGPGAPPLGLLMDRRLASWVSSGDGRQVGDSRDLVDRGGDPFFTYDERTVGYARSLERPVHRGAFDRRYYLILAQPADPDAGRSIARRIGRQWESATTLDSRRAWEEPVEGSPADCWPATISPDPPPTAESGLRPTVRYPASDPAARDLAERLVSASLPGRAIDLGLGSLSVRAGPVGDIAPSDVAIVLPVPVGDVHPCSIRGEVEAEAIRLGGASSDGGLRVFPLGESARFRIDPRGTS